ncbi:MAG: hypothetical protein CMD77_06250 [Gammaproteobacteria bacterium]|nr:hypothetical protein [Gammaproteobacteria bacterium]|tara:strand:+ start:6392 stop:7564 length:1173 start_codon:yes stop_codon:yes gene_type:complete
MKYPIQIPSLYNFSGFGVVLILSWWIKIELEQIQTNVVYLSLWIGIFFGVVLQRSRFCFYCLSRDFIEKKDSKGLLGIVVALIIGTIGYHFIFGAFLIDPISPNLPPNAHISPVSLVLVLGSFCFGFGMSIAGSCISAQLYRLGEGLLSALISLIGIVIGFIIAFQVWNFLYLEFIANAPVIWFPHHVGYGGSIFLQLTLLILLAFFLLVFNKEQKKDEGIVWWKVRWPTYVGGILVGLIAMLSFLRVAPLGVTAEISDIAKTTAGYFQFMPPRLEGLETLRGCIILVKNSFWSNNGLLIVGLVLGSLASAIFSEDFRIQLPNRIETVNSFIGGILMGFGAMIALGCTVGNLLSGIMAASLSGWVFLIFCGLGLYLGWLIKNKYLTKKSN